jgi:hypothetical protein
LLSGKCRRGGKLKDFEHRIVDDGSSNAAALVVTRDVVDRDLSRNGHDIPDRRGKDVGAGESFGHPFDTRWLGDDESACDAAKTSTAAPQTTKAAINRLWRMAYSYPT